MQPKESLIRFLFLLNVNKYGLNLNMLLVYLVRSLNAVLAQQVEHFHGKEEGRQFKSAKRLQNMIESNW